MSILIALAGIAALVALIAWVRLTPFLSFLVVSIGLGLALGLSPLAVSASVQRGLGDTLGSLVIIIGLGSMLGKIVAESGAAQRIATTLMARSGPHYIHWALMATGFVIGLPLFFSVGFILLIPIIFGVATQYRLPAVFVGLPAVAALSVTHGYLPPHPGPAALVQQFGGDMGRTLLLGTLVAIPAIVLGGPVLARFVRHIDSRPRDAFITAPRATDTLPSLTASLVCALLPVVLLSAGTLLRSAGLVGGHILVDLISDPGLALLAGVLVAVLWLGLAGGHTLPVVMRWCEQAITDVALILLIVGGAGAFKQVLTDGGASVAIATALETLQAPPLVLAWGMAVLVRVCVGSATVAALTTAGLVAPLVGSQGVDPDLLVLSIGAGSLALSHVNDGGFWLFKEYFNISIKECLMTWTVMETIVAVVGLAGVLVLDALLA
jgi:Gnt-I system high-affinity gluconate transporter